MKYIFSRRLIVATLVAILASGCSETEEPIKPTPRGVLHEQVELFTSSMSSIFSGVTQAHVDAKMSFKVPGTVLERPVNIGMSVPAGTLLARLDDRDYASSVQQAQAQLRASQAQQRQAEANYERLISLYENRNTSLSELETARAAADSTKASVTAASETLRQAQLQLSYTRLVAPEQCEVAETYVRADENVDAGTPVVRLTCGSCPEVRINLPQTQISLVESGQAVEVTVTGVDARSFPATVSEIGVASTSGATFPVTALFSGRCPELRSGIAADVRFDFDTGEAPQITVPSVAVGEDAEGRFVFVLEPQSDGLYTAQRRPVEIGELNEAARFVVTNGLTTGEVIATAGVRRIQDGQIVRLADALRS